MAVIIPALPDTNIVYITQFFYYGWCYNTGVHIANAHAAVKAVHGIG